MQKIIRVCFFNFKTDEKKKIETATTYVSLKYIKLETCADNFKFSSIFLSRNYFTTFFNTQLKFNYYKNNTLEEGF